MLVMLNLWVLKSYVGNQYLRYFDLWGLEIVWVLRNFDKGKFCDYSKFCRYSKILIL